MTDRILVETDRLTVSLSRVGPVAGPPTLLVPGLGATPLAYSLHPRVSLAERLSQAGHTPWTLDFFLSWRRPGQDSGALLRACQHVLERLARESGYQQAEFTGIGHSLGGLLLLALAVSGSAPRRLVCLATGLDYRLGESNLKRALGLLPFARPLRRGLPIRRLARWVAPFTGRPPRLSFETDQFHPGSTRGFIIRRFMREGVRDLSVPLLRDLAELFTEQGLVLGTDGRALKYAVGALDIPVLLVAAGADRQCSLETVRDAAGRIPQGQLLELLGPWGHLDLLTGDAAPERVFDPIIDFLAPEA